MRAFHVVVLCLVLFGNFAVSQTFKQHKIDETAQQFFSVATVAEHGAPTVRYCADYLREPKVQKAYDKAQRNVYDTQAIIDSSDSRRLS